MKQTVSAVVKASTLPVSIIIVGIGSANFDTMEMLDGDGGFLKDDQNKTAVRDCVQFVALRNYTNPIEFTRDLLGELPRQVVDYYKIKGLKPENI